MATGTLYIMVTGTLNNIMVTGTLYNIIDDRYFIQQPKIIFSFTVVTVRFSDNNIEIVTSYPQARRLSIVITPLFLRAG
jgi:hypothetical protein